MLIEDSIHGRGCLAIDYDWIDGCCPQEHKSIFELFLFNSEFRDGGSIEEMEERDWTNDELNLEEMEKSEDLSEKFLASDWYIAHKLIHRVILLLHLFGPGYAFLLLA